MKVMFLDVETTGKDSKLHDIVELAVIFEIDGRVTESFKWNCQPFNWDTIEQEALDVHGTTIEQLKEYQDPHKVHAVLTKITDRYVNKYDKNDKLTLAGQKVEFDAGFLREFFFKAGDQYFGSRFNYRHIDLLATVRMLRYAGVMELANDRLETIAAHFGIELKAHDALEDIMATRKALQMILERYIRRPGEPIPGPLVLLDDGVVREEELDRETGDPGGYPGGHDLKTGGEQQPLL